MTRVTHPLFSSWATGPIAGLGSFRMGRHGPEFIFTATPHDPSTTAQEAHRALFRQARAEWKALTLPRPKWGPWWAQWYIAYMAPAPATPWFRSAVDGNGWIHPLESSIIGLHCIENPP